MSEVTKPVETATPPAATPAPATPPPAAPAVTTPPPATPAPEKKDSGSETPPAKPEEKKETPATAEPEKKSEGEKPEEKKVVPEKYDLKLPENAALEPVLLDKIAAHAKAQGLSQEEAQALVEQQNETMGSIYSELSKSYLAECLADKEIGGDNLQKNVALANRVLERFDQGNDLKRDLDRTGYGNYPKLVRFLVRVGSAMSEQDFVRPGNKGGGEKPIEDYFYGKTETETKGD